MFGLTGLYLRAAEWACLIALIFGAYFWAYDKGETHEREANVAAQIAANDQATKKYNLVAQQLEDLKLTRAQNAKTIEHTVEKITEHVVYANSCWDDDGLRAANAALKGGTTGITAPALPATKPD